MIKLIDLLKEEDFFTTRRSKEERSKNYIIAIQKKIQQYIKDGNKGNLHLSDTPITSLPNGLKVGGSLDLTGTKIETLPNDLKVGGYLDLMYTPLAKKYTKQQFIRKIAPGVKGDIYL
jgi:hypothetical protein